MNRGTVSELVSIGQKKLEVQKMHSRTATNEYFKYPVGQSYSNEPRPPHIVSESTTDIIMIV